VERVPLFEDRPPAVQIVGGIVVPVIFGLLTGFALSWNEVVYLLLVGPVGIIGGLLAGTEHRGADEGFVRGLIGGLVFSSFILLGLKITGDEPTAELADPRVGYVLFITLVSGALGALGAALRARRARRALGQGGVNSRTVLD
jgi:hypothetical protein